MLEKIASLGVMGFIALAIVVTVCSLAAYSVVQGLDNQNTTALVTVLTTGAGGVLAAAGKFFGGSGGSGA